MDITISLITTLVLTLINGYFSMSEMALTTAKRAVLEHEAEEGDKRAERAIKLAADSDQLLATIQVAITLVGFASSAVASTSLSDPLATWLMSFGIAPLSAIARGLAPVIITVAVMQDLPEITAQLKKVDVDALNKVLTELPALMDTVNSLQTQVQNISNWFSSLGSVFGR